MTFDILTWIVMPLLIIILRVLDVSLGTVRVVTINKGLRAASAGIGFFEILVWLFAAQTVLNNMDNIIWFIAYAAGFAIGTYIGICISDRLSLGKVMVRVITKNDPVELIKQLKKHKFRLTAAKTENDFSSGQLILSVIESKHLSKYLELVHTYNPKAFYSVEDVKKVSDEHFPKKERKYTRHQIKKRVPAIGAIIRKGK
ncbi:MAG: DUF2179 domain-containing protein [Candidatus Nanoarchaeia archaeon]